VNEPLVSVVITTYNRVGLVYKCIDSVLSQSYKNIEVIIVDDCSTDDTENYFQNNYQGALTYIRHEENQGVQYASNTGYRYCRGKYVAFIGDDDQWSDKDKIKAQVDVFEDDTDKKYAIVTTDVNFIGKEISYKKCIKRPKNLIKHILNGNGIIYGSAALLRSDIFKVAGQFKEELPKGTDSDVFRRIIFLGYDVFFIEKVMIDYHFDMGDNMTVLNEKGLNRSIVAQNYKLDKYRVLMNCYPDVKSRALYLIACYYYLQWTSNGNNHAIKLSSIYFKASFKAYPLNVKALLKLFRNYIEVFRYA
jgi:glycosyltransferase involved in cell wall biosynthesis